VGCGERHWTPVPVSTYLETDWRAAACASHDPDLWWPHPEEHARRNKALDICSTCPLREPCLRLALDEGHDQGIWGMTTPEERKAMRRRSA